MGDSRCRRGRVLYASSRLRAAGSLTAAVAPVPAARPKHPLLLASPRAERRYSQRQRVARGVPYEVRMRSRRTARSRRRLFGALPLSRHRWIVRCVRIGRLQSAERRLQPSVLTLEETVRLRDLTTDTRQLAQQTRITSCE